ncbi:hypothetical protein [Flaviaesturariibacter amylovorans]|uniref:hypothetical protein n=1 Tax=Flaviaesturariibacter amylovorans TaxID=1084520 RepID=UPI0031E7B901
MLIEGPQSHLTAYFRAEPPILPVITGTLPVVKGKTPLLPDCVCGLEGVLISLMDQTNRSIAPNKMTHILDALFARYRQRVKPPALP